MSTGPADHRLRTFRTPFRRIEAHDRASFRLPYRILESSERKRAHETDDLHRRRRLPGHVRNPGRRAQERVARGRCGQRDAEPCAAHQARRSARAPRRVLGGHAARGHRRRRGRLRHRAGAGTRRHRGDAGHRAGRHGAGTARGPSACAGACTRWPPSTSTCTSATRRRKCAARAGGRRVPPPSKTMIASASPRTSSAS